ncbi:hypothetical protein NDU88_009583 [Pleurodeles waltl]|uniref:Uncharacterized protein n=1 Tax=Pleurodeles waltl TaxID=8319 RepID=A0AAV7QT71_PLEWA|nr:hypothetical protein NDU88_009583 [Pleurodeles waltl]
MARSRAVREQRKPVQDRNSPPDEPLPVLPKIEAEILDEPISSVEITELISSLASGKTLGPDGFPSEYYKNRWPCILR